MPENSETATQTPEPPCHSLPQEQWCDHAGPGGFMGHTCFPKTAAPQPLAESPIAEPPSLAALIADSIRRVNWVDEAMLTEALPLPMKHQALGALYQALALTRIAEILERIDHSTFHILQGFDAIARLAEALERIDQRQAQEHDPFAQAPVKPPIDSEPEKS